MKNTTRLLIPAAILGLALFGLRQWNGVRQPIVHASPTLTGNGIQAVTLIFGEKDAQPQPWDGSAVISTGEIVRISGWHFTEESKILDNHSWVCSTHPWTPFQPGMDPRERPQPHATPLEPIGVTVYYRAAAGATIDVKLAKGREFSFRPADLPEIEGIYPLGATIDVHRSPVSEQITDAASEDDFPSVASDGKMVWAAWQSYRNGGDTIYVRALRGGTWDQPVAITEKPGDLFMTAIASTPRGAAVVWSEHEGANFHLKARTLEGSALGAVESVTSGSGNSLFHRIAADRAGNLHVVYQRSDRGRSNIFLRSKVNGRWTAEVALSDRSRDARANDWNPAVAAGANGAVWVAWDGYASGSYNVYLREVRSGQPGPLLKVTDSTRYHAHPALAVDAQDRLWIAWEEAPENWGKDVGFLFETGSALYDARDVKVAVYSNGRWLTPLRQPAESMPIGLRGFIQTPRLVASAAGVWLLLRPMTSSKLPTTHWKAGGKWEVCGMYYSADRWSRPVFVPDSVGRNGGEVDAAAGPDGKVYVALNTDHKLWGGPNFGHYPGNNDIVFTSLGAAGAAPPQLAPRPAEQPGGLPSEPHEREEIARLRNFTIQANGAAYHIYRGDLHRHTEISLDGAGDGTLWDAYRYALDAAGLDFLVVTDHQSGSQDYTYWRIQKAADMFHVPGYFTAVYGTERSVPYPNGHRNLLFSQRGVPILDISPEERQAKVNSGPILFPFLKKYNGISSPHSPHTNMGTDWRDNDPSVEPIVEIWEGSRTSAEHESGPLAPNAKQTELWAGGYRPLGFVWNAWAKGYRLGVQASSDHASTHLSYTCVIAENSSREALIDAMRKRHTYAATRNILLDYRMQANGRTYLQGDEFESSTQPEISVEITGTAPLKTVVIVRDNQYIYSREPGTQSFELRYRDQSATPGKHYYYVRIQQQDQHMAWSSPIWIDYRP